MFAFRHLGAIACALLLACGSREANPEITLANEIEQIRRARASFEVIRRLEEVRLFDADAGRELMLEFTGDQRLLVRASTVYSLAIYSPNDPRVQQAVRDFVLDPKMPLKQRDDILWQIRTHPDPWQREAVDLLLAQARENGWQPAHDWN